MVNVVNTLKHRPSGAAPRNHRLRRFRRLVRPSAGSHRQRFVFDFGFAHRNECLRDHREPRRSSRSELRRSSGKRPVQSRGADAVDGDLSLGQAQLCGPHADDQTSILRFIEENWSLGQVGGGSFDAIANPINNMFNFSPREPSEHNPADSFADHRPAAIVSRHMGRTESDYTAQIS